MSTTEDHTSGASGMAEQQGQGLWVGGLREGYAEIGDVRLHYVEAGEGPLIVLLHGFPEFWYGWRQQIQPLAAAGFRVVAPDMRGYNLSSKPDGVAAYDTDKLAADVRDLIHERGAQSALLVGHDWGGTVAWATAMNHPEVVDRLAILNAAHPRKLSQGLHHPGQLRKSWYFFFFDLPEVPESRRARQPVAFLPALPARRPPGVHAGGDGPLHRGVVAAGRGHRDDQLLPVLGTDLAQARRSGASPDHRRPPWSSGGRTIATSAPNSPSPTTTTCPTWTASSACPTPRTGCITTRPSASHNCSSTSSPPLKQPRTAECRRPNGWLRRSICGEGRSLGTGWPVAGLNLAAHVVIIRIMPRRNGATQTNFRVTLRSDPAPPC